MAEQYKLTYFNIRGVAEPIRFIFAQAGVPYEDVRIEKENWPAIKPTTRWGTLPFLQIGDQVLGQSLTISRYLARKYNLAGETPMEEARVDELVDALADLKAEWRKGFTETDEAKKAALNKVFTEETVPRIFGKFTAIKEANGGPWLVGKNVTWADFQLAVYVDFSLTSLGPNALDAFPVLLAHKKAVFDLPRIAEWVAKRPPA